MDKKGFTLIELMIVVGIIGILAAISIPGYIGYQKRAARTEAYGNLENLRLLEEQYYAENGRYTPEDDSTLEYKGTHGDASDTGLEDELPGFKPGQLTALNFVYTVETTNSAQEFVATATGKGGSRVDGETYTINQNNVRDF